MRFSSATWLVIGVLLLAGCSRTTGGAGLVRPNLPALPRALSISCSPPPTVLLTEDKGVAVGKTRRALGRCSRRHRDLVRFYDGLRGRLK